MMMQECLAQVAATARLWPRRECAQRCLVPSKRYSVSFVTRNPVAMDYCLQQPHYGPETDLRRIDCTRAMASVDSQEYVGTQDYLAGLRRATRCGQGRPGCWMSESVSGWVTCSRTARGLMADCQDQWHCRDSAS